MQRDKYKTKQGSLVLSLMADSGGKHLTIDEICTLLKQNGTPVGKTTVYRQVQKLLDEGLVTKYSVDSESGACYQYSGQDCKMHFHLKCTRCAKLFHASCEFIESIESHIFSHHGFSVDNTKTVFYGVCRDCLRQDKKTSIHNHNHEEK